MDIAESDISLEEKAYNRLKNAIMNLEVRPGQKLSQKDWTETLGMSRTPLREALKRLEYEGMVVRESNRLWRIYTLTFDEINQLYELREALETAIVRLAAKRITPAQSEKLSELINKMDYAVKSDDKNQFRVIDGEFHKLLSEMANNPYLNDAIRIPEEKLSRLMNMTISLPGRLTQVLGENSLIANAIRCNDPDAAEEAQREHLKNSQNSLVTLLQGVSALFGTRF